MYKKAIIIHLLVLAISVVCSSCCETIITVTSDFTVSFTDLEKEVTISPSQDTIRGPFIYSLDAALIVDNIQPGGINLMYSANATSCNEVYENGYQVQTASLVLDRPFILDGNTIPAGTNILALDAQFKAGDYNAQVYEYGIRVWFKSAFLQRASFPLSVYNFIASVQMEDGTIIESQDSVIIQIN